ncbi:hypothetical protein ABZ372_43930, partial [Streptomyces sp. NPDC005921]
MTTAARMSPADWTDGLGLARVLHGAGPVVALWRDGAATAEIDEPQQSGVPPCRHTRVARVARVAACGYRLAQPHQDTGEADAAGQVALPRPALQC